MTDVLIIETDESIRYLYKTAIEFQGLKVEAAKSTLEGLEVLKKETLKLIIIDVLTPDLKEMNIVSELRKVIKGEMPVIIMTDLHDGSESNVESIFGACEFLSKHESTVGDVIKKVREITEREAK